MNIVCLSEREYGCGASIAGYRLAQGLAAAGHTVHWWYGQPFAAGAPNAQALARRQFPAALDLNKLEGGFAKISTALWGKFLARRWRQNFDALRRWLTEVRADVVLLNNVDRILNHRQVSLLADQYPTVWLVHSNLAFEPFHYRFALPGGGEETAYSYPPALVDTEAQRAMIGHPNLTFVTPSSWLEQHNRALHGTLPDIRRIPYGVDPRLFFPEKTGHKPGAKIRVLFVASNVGYPRKNIRVLLAALPHLPADRFRFQALGKDTDGLADRYPQVEFLSPSYAPADLRRHYSAADYFFIPSLIDNLPNTVLESLFCGTPVIGSRTGGVPDMVVPGTSGVLFDPYDAQDLVRVLLKIVAQPPTCLRGKLLHDWALERYGLTGVTARYEQLFQEKIDDFRADAGA